MIDPTGIHELDGSAGIAVYPNPVNNQLVIRFAKAGVGSSWTDRITDILGKVVSEKMIGTVQSAGEFKWDVSSLSPGAYFLTLQNQDQMLVKKIIRQ